MINLSVYKDAGFTSEQMRSLEALLDKEKLHWITLNEEIGVYEIVVDNQMLSTYRACPAHFMELYVHGHVLKGTGARSWPLEFGIVFHTMMEYYYAEFREKNFDMQDWGIARAVAEWNDKDMNFHQEHKEFKSLGGVQGFCGLLLGYAIKFGTDNERLRVIGTEIKFGKAQEVLIGSLRLDMPNIFGWLDVYLSGRMDLLVDDGSFIGPMDHKTMNSFRGDPSMRFELDEGPTGYIYAISTILPNFLKSIGQEDLITKRSTNKILMNLISKSIPKEGERYKRLPIYKSTEQLESYRLRMLATSEDLFRDLVRYAHTNIATRDTSKCTNWWMHDCMYLPVHRQNSRSNELAVLNSFYEKKEIWDTEEV